MKRTNKIISLVVTLAIILSSMIFVVPTAVSAAEAAPAWSAADAGDILTGTGAAEDLYKANLQGSGTEEDPYLIGTAAEFVAFTYAANYKTGDPAYAGAHASDAAEPTMVYYQLTADIDLSEKHWGASAAHEYNAFALDGNGKTITVAFKNDPANNSGLFGTLNRNSYVHDLDLIGTWKQETAKQPGFVGLLAGRSYASTIENVNATIDIELSYSNNSTQVCGGLIGYATYNNHGVAGAKQTELTNVTVTGSIKTTTTGGSNTAVTFGGLTGRITGAVCTDCVVDVDFNINRLTGAKSVNRVGAYTGLTAHDNALEECKFINCVNTSDFVFVDNATDGYVGTWIGQAGNQYTADVPHYFTNCVDVATWTHNRTGAQHALIGRMDLAPVDKENFENAAIIEGLFTTAKLYNSAKDGAPVYSASGMLAGFEAIYQDLGDSVQAIINLNTWQNLVDEVYPVYATIGFNGEETADFEADEELNVALITLEKGDAEEGTLPEVLFYSVESGELVYTMPITDSDVNWTTFRAAEFENGEYVKGQPVEIANASQLALLAFMANNGTNFANSTITLLNDIDLAGFEWIPIGHSHGAGFQGKIDGAGYSIKNMTLTAPSYNYGIGFIGHANGGFELKNVTFVDPVIAPGAVAGTINGITTVINAFYGGVIDGVDVVGLDLTVPKTVVNGHYVGGMVGYHGNDKSTLKNSTVSGIIHGESIVADAHANGMGYRVGGLVARPRYGYVLNCVSNVDIDVTIDFAWRTAVNNVTDDEGTVLGTGIKYMNSNNLQVGGIIGELNSYGGELTDLENCTNNGDIKVTVLSGSTTVRMGGIAGSATSAGFLHIKGCQNNGTLEIVRPNGYATPELGEFDVMDTLEQDAIAGIIGRNQSVVVIEDSSSVVYNDVQVGVNAGNGLDMNMDDFAVLAGARVRIDATEGLANSGLRFDAKINANLYKYIVGTEQGKGQNDSKRAKIKIGMMIVPVDMINDDTVAADLYKDANILKVDFTQEDFYNVDSEGYGYFSAAIINLKAANYDREFVAIPYIQFNESFAGTVHMMFGDINLDNARSAAFVAGKALEDTTAGYTAEQIAVLQQYVA